MTNLLSKRFSSKKKNKRSSIFFVVIFILCGTLVNSCKPNEQKIRAEAIAIVPKESVKTPAQSVKPEINFVATEKLYKKIKQKKLGSGAGLIRIDKNNGILIHPGASPTEVIFDLSGMKEILKLAFWISGLPQNILPIAKAGTVGFEVFVDGKSLGRKRVDRLTNQTLLINPQGLSKLRIVVDNDDGAQTCDWFFMGLQ
jgi:hypothetical protein